MVVRRDVIEGEPVRLGVVGEATAHPMVDGPHVGVAVVEQEAGQVAVFGHREQVAGGGESVHEKHDVVGVGPAEAGEHEPQTIVGRHRVQG
jgi:hypothetical protein